MPEYLAPGVYVEEVPSAIKPIAGVSTSTAGFIGIVPNSFQVPTIYAANEQFTGDGAATEFKLKALSVATDKSSYRIKVEGRNLADSSKLENRPPQSFLVVSVTLEPGDIVTASYKGTKSQTFNSTDVKSSKVSLTVPPGTQAVTLTSVTDNATTPAPITDAKVNKSSGGFDLVLTTLPKSATFTAEYSVDVQNGAVGTVGTGAPLELQVDSLTAGTTPTVQVNGTAVEATGNTTGKPTVTVPLTTAVPVPPGGKISVDYTIGPVTETLSVPATAGKQLRAELGNSPVQTDPNTFVVRINNAPVDAQIINDPTGHSYVSIDLAPAAGQVSVEYTVFSVFEPDPVGTAVLCTSFSEYKKHFGDFSTDEGQRNLTHAVYGFFNNGGTRCYVTRITGDGDIDDALASFARVSEIAIVVVPGAPGTDPGKVSDTLRSNVVAHCQLMGDRFAIFDGPQSETSLDKLTQVGAGGWMPNRTDYAAWYFPWIKVFDPVQKMLLPNGDGTIYAPPSGHIAGVYARVDGERGVHKAPANEPILGALGVSQPLSKAEQDGLNPKGVNCIRVINDNILVWGARTVGGDANADLKYINVRRTLLFLRKSIYEGTQWVVFEPNSTSLWQKITRNVTAFLTNVWRGGALFGNTPQEAFYVKCDAETNPPELRDLGQVVTEIGVAIVRPAEFVIFRISQMAGPGT
ncbi:MAG TPA: phage tail sheath subtilisin-like domain-containing protein [Pyrinomonadaceae bacterium]